MKEKFCVSEVASSLACDSHDTAQQKFFFPLLAEL